MAPGLIPVMVPMVLRISCLESNTVKTLEKRLCFLLEVQQVVVN